MENMTEETVIETETDDVEQAIADSAAKLGVKREALAIEIVDSAGRGGLLGLKKRKSIVKARIKSRGEIASEIAARIFELLGMAVDIELLEQEETTTLNVSGEDLGLAIGRHGQTMDAIQLLVGIMAARANPSGKKVVVDIQGYRKQREEDVRAMAERAVRKVQDTGQPFDFRPMTAFDRKVVHMVVAEHNGLTSRSSGEEPERHVTVEQG